jgi:hypothetical protein
MRTVWKVLLGLAVVLPLGAYVAGSLAASAADDPAPRTPIELRDPGPGRTTPPAPSHTPSASDEPEVITPSYDDLDDDHDDDHGGDRHGEDDHGGDDHRGDDHGGRGHG